MFDKFVKVQLIAQEVSTDTTSDGEPIIIEQATEVIAKLTATKRNEYYQAQALGLKIELTLNIYDFEYCGQKLLDYNGTRYNILRTYPIKGEMLELICNDIVKDNRYGTT